jgi:hypothetical protein
MTPPQGEAALEEGTNEHCKSSEASPHEEKMCGDRKGLHFIVLVGCDVVLFWLF